jgi:shikimate dehydrogenase
MRGENGVDPGGVPAGQEKQEEREAEPSAAGGGRRRAAVLGFPVAQSLSPVLHRAAYSALGLDWSYDAIGDNTDVYGIVTALAEAGVSGPTSVVVLGGGATACSAVAAVSELGLATATVVVRDPNRAAAVRAAADRLGITVRVVSFDRLPDAVAVADLVISTVPAGAADPYAATVARSGAAVFDVVYVPWPTPLGRAVEAAGGIVVGGFPMLLHQAARQVELMSGRRAPVAAMRTAGLAALAARAAAPSAS